MQLTVQESDLKVKAIREFPLPETRKKLREFLGLINFYRRFIKNCATLTYPLNSLLSTPKLDNQPLQWTDNTRMAFTAAKQVLATATLLFHPTPEAPTSLMTDASACAVGAVLQQYVDYQWCPIAYFSRQLQPAEKKYSTLTENCWQFIWQSNIFVTLLKVVNLLFSQIINPLHSVCHSILIVTYHVRFVIWIIFPNSPPTSYM